MKKYLSRPENHLCADCKRPSPTWASLNKGVFVCIKCSGCHREIGVHVTKIKSVELDLWPSKSLTDFAKINNEIANAYWEYDLRNYDFQKIRDNEIRLIEFIRDKYEHKRWVKPNVPEPMNLVIQGRDLVKEFMNNGEAVKLYEKSDAPELEKRIRHFNRDKNVKKGRDFGIVSKTENTNNNINNQNINNNAMNNNNQEQQNMNQNQENHKEEKKGFVFIKKKFNNQKTANNASNINNVNNNINNNNNTNNTVVDLLGFGNDDLNEPNNITNNINNSGMNNIIPMDIFSFGQENNITNINNNQNNNNANNINENINNTNNNINVNNTNNNEENKPKSGFIFIKNKKKPPTQNNNIVNTNNDINSLFETNQNAPANNNENNNVNNNVNNNANNLNIPNNTKTENNANQNPNSNASGNSSSNSIINLFESNQLVDLFNIETPTSDAVLNLSKNLINIYSTEKEEDNINKPINNNNMLNNNPNTNSNYNVLNMNYPNININNYYPNNEQQQNKNKPMMNNPNYGMNPMMGFNYPNQGGYMNNNFGFWYGYNMNNMNMNTNYMNMGMGMNNPINTGFNYKNELYNEHKNEKEKEEQKPVLFDLNLGRDIKPEKEEQKPILLNNNTFEFNFKRDVRKEKEDPFKNLVNFN